MAYSPFADSPALDVGINSTCMTVDQWNNSRPKDDNGDGFANCDLGAIEVVKINSSKDAVGSSENFLVKYKTMNQ